MFFFCTSICCVAVLTNIKLLGVKETSSELCFIHCYTIGNAIDHVLRNVAKIHLTWPHLNTVWHTHYVNRGLQPLQDFTTQWAWWVSELGFVFHTTKRASERLSWLLKYKQQENNAGRHRSLLTMTFGFQIQNKCFIIRKFYNYSDLSFSVCSDLCCVLKALYCNVKKLLEKWHVRSSNAPSFIYFKKSLLYRLSAFIKKSSSYPPISWAHYNVAVI